MMRNLLIFLLVTLSGQRVVAQASYDSSLTERYLRGYLEEELGFNMPSHCNYMLYDTISSWIGTPYRFAGNAESGVDCSGFVNVLFDRVYGIRIGARNSTDIYKLCQKVDPDELQEGDLLFFRIRSRSRISHVGFYLGNNKFVHASTSQGVMISDMNEPYYKKYFAGAGRHQMLLRNATVLKNPVE